MLTAEQIFCLLRVRLHEQIKPALFAQILTELLDTNPKIEQIQAAIFAHVNPALVKKGKRQTTAKTKTCALEKGKMGK